MPLHGWTTEATMSDTCDLVNKYVTIYIDKHMHVNK